MTDRGALEELFRKHDCGDFTWMDPADMVVGQWVRMKCMFGCDGYGRNAACPPNVPSVSECRDFFSEYTAAAIFHFQNRFDVPEGRHDWTRDVNQSLLDLERDVFLAGYVKAFLLLMGTCRFCSDCVSRREECVHPMQARPTAEGMAVDVFSTVRRYDLPIDVLRERSEPMNRYAFLLVE